MKTITLTVNELILLRELVLTLRKQVKSDTGRFVSPVSFDRKLTVPEYIDLVNIEKKVWEIE